MEQIDRPDRYVKVHRDHVGLVEEYVKLLDRAEEASSVSRQEAK